MTIYAEIAGADPAGASEAVCARVPGMDFDLVDLRVNVAGRDVWPEGHHLPEEWFRRRLNDYDLWLIWQGSGFFQKNGAPPVPLHRGVRLFLQPGEPCRAWQSEGGQLGVIWIHFDIVHRTKGVRLAPDRLPVFFFDATRTEFFENLANRMVHLWRELPFLDARLRDAGQRLLGLMLRTLLEGYEFDLACAETDDVAGVDRHHRQMVAQALEEFHARYQEIRSISAVAAALGYSPDHFCRIFTDVTGRTPRRALMAIRIDRAKHLLRHSDLSVGAVAEAVGYGSIFPFSKRFKEEVGCSPSAFRVAPPCVGND